MFHQKLARALARACPVSLLAVLVLAVPAPGALAAAPETFGETFPVSVSAAGEWADGEGVVEYTTPSISADGRFAAFQSASRNLGENGPAGVVEGFVKDLETGAVSLVTRADGPGGEAAGAPGISNLHLSRNGRFAIFTSAATNLGAGLSGEPHVYRRDLETGETAMVDPADGAEAQSISADGRYVAFVAGGVGYVRDMEAGSATVVSRATGATGAIGDEPAEWLSLAPDGRSVVFSSRATNLVPGVDEGVWSQVYLRDLETEETSLVSQNALGEPGDRTSSLAGLSGGAGCFVSFSSNSLNLLDPSLGVSGEQVYLADICAASPAVTLVSKGDSSPFAAIAYTVSAASADGGSALFAGEFGNFFCCHLFLRDLGAGETFQLDRASGSAGASADAEVQEFALAENGCRAVFATRATNLYGAGPPPGEEPTELYVRQLAPCAEPPPGGPGEGSHTGGPGPAIPPATGKLTVRRVGSRALVLDLSAPGQVTVRVRRLVPTRPREWKLVRTIERGVDALGALQIPLAGLTPGRYRLNIHLHGTPAGVVRWLTVDP